MANLFQAWQFWLDCLEHKRFSPLWLDRKTYTVIGDLINHIDRNLAITQTELEMPDSKQANQLEPSADLDSSYDHESGHDQVIRAGDRIKNSVGVGVDVAEGGDRYVTQNIQNNNIQDRRIREQDLQAGQDYRDLIQDLSKQPATTSLLLPSEFKPKSINNPAVKPPQIDKIDQLDQPDHLEIEAIAPVKLIQPIQSFTNVNELLQQYYSWHLNQQEFQQLYQRIVQALQNHLTKLNQKLDSFSDRLSQSAQADVFKQQADLLMANLQQWQPGMSTITLPDFVSDQPVEISLNPEKNAAQNAQLLYKKHQKQKRAKLAILPLMAEVRQEINYLEQVLTAAHQATEVYALEVYPLGQVNQLHHELNSDISEPDRLASSDRVTTDLQTQDSSQQARDSAIDATTTGIVTLREILQELGQQGYLKKEF
jgi:predicted ribosome quality control (RQC) complex YloA/Tae2 family protein